MKEYLISLVSVSLVCAIAAYLIPDREEKLKGGVDLALALVVLFSAVCPLPVMLEMSRSLLEPERSIFDAGVAEESGEWLNGATKAALAEAIRRDVMREFGLTDGVNVSVCASLGSEIVIERVIVRLSKGAALADGLAIESYIESGCRAECEVLIDGT